MASYNDGFPLTAPPGNFEPNRLGLYDLSGNVAEWCHDFYQIYRSGRKFVDPTGPETGRHRVVRGSSWKHGSISTLRISYRDYSDSKRNDLGFRIARYVE
jgi:formylglycine-generating enzyme required for sulfatase activity